jgi:hypothetical protein
MEIYLELQKKNGFGMASLACGERKREFLTWDITEKWF